MMGVALGRPQAHRPQVRLPPIFASLTHGCPQRGRSFAARARAWAGQRSLVVSMMGVALLQDTSPLVMQYRRSATFFG
jgi:hypothetical protein